MNSIHGTHDLEAEKQPLSILYEDEWIVAVNKPAGQLVHPADTPAEGDLVTMKILRDQIDQQVYVIHRIDRPTCGVLLFATDQEVARGLHATFENKEVEKVYWAVVDGTPLDEQWTCQEPIRKGEERVERAAATSFQVLEHLPENLALVQAKPKTGRFHQIRQHLLHAKNAHRWRLSIRGHRPLRCTRHCPGHGNSHVAPSQEPTLHSSSDQRRDPDRSSRRSTDPESLQQKSRQVIAPL